MQRRNPVVFIHGIDDASARMRPLDRHLRACGWDTHNVELVPNSGAVGLEELARQVSSFVDSRLGSQQAVDLVGFSMGGIVARHYVQRLGGQRRVQRLVTISSPHRGTWAAFCRNSAGARQMRPRSDFLRDLDRDRHLLSSIRFTSLWTPFDLMILPADSSVLPEARCVRVNVAAHVLMVSDKRVLRLVEQALLS
jgi:triacylglycerol lipase